MARARASARTPRIVSPGSAAKVNPIGFLQETFSELRKSVWPSREEVSRLTVIVIALSIVMGFYLGGLDRLLTETFDRYVLIG